MARPLTLSELSMPVGSVNVRLGSRGTSRDNQLPLGLVPDTGGTDASALSHRAQVRDDDDDDNDDVTTTTREVRRGSSCFYANPNLTTCR